jgi:hypothetical protein
VQTVPRLCEFYPGICHTTEEKPREDLRQGNCVPRRTSSVYANFSLLAWRRWSRFLETSDYFDSFKLNICQNCILSSFHKISVCFGTLKLNISQTAVLFSFQRTPLSFGPFKLNTVENVYLTNSTWRPHKLTRTEKYFTYSSRTTRMYQNQTYFRNAADRANQETKKKNINNIA